MSLQPLKQWICDTCGEIIESAGDGYLEWVTDDERRGREFRIVHHKPKSPRATRDGCYTHTARSRRHDIDLKNFVGADGMANLIGLLDLGRRFEDERPQVQSTREFAELVRRLYIPHYEEARMYWDEAEHDGYFGDANEIWPYTQGSLRGIIKTTAVQNVLPTCEASVGSVG